MRRAAFLAFVLTAQFGTACAPTPPAPAPSASTAVRVPSPAGRGSPQAWRYALPAAWDLSHVAFGEGAVVLGGTDIRVLDSESGQLRWHVEVVDRSIYGYGDVRALRSSPQRIATDLADFPVLLGHGLLAVRRRVRDGSIRDEIVRIHDGALEAHWSSPEPASAIFGYDASAAPDVLRILHVGPALLNGMPFARQMPP